MKILALGFAIVNKETGALKILPDGGLLIFPTKEEATRWSTDWERIISVEVRAGETRITQEELEDE